MTGREVWAFDVDGCVVDSLTGRSLRPLTFYLLALLRRQRVSVLWWSAGGARHARERALALNADGLVDAYYDKHERDADGRWTLLHLPRHHVPWVVVDDRPDEAPAACEHVVAVSPYIAPDPHDLGLQPVLRFARRGPTA